MESLAGLFVSLVFVANSLFPQSNIPQVLGVKTVQKLDSQETSLKASEERIKKALIIRDKKTDNASGSAEKRIQEIKTNREEFKNKITEIRDEKKKERLTKLDDNLTKFNQKAVEHWNKTLDRLTSILDKIKTRTNEAAGKGKDTTSILAAISVAETKIADAKSAVNSQSAKSYVITIGEEDKLKESASSTVSVMKSDIKLVGEVVKEAIQSVKDVHVVLKAVVGS